MYLKSAEKVVLSAFDSGAVLRARDVQAHLLKTIGRVLSDSTIRDAMMRLAHHGLIERLYRGTYRKTGATAPLGDLGPWVQAKLAASAPKKLTARQLADLYRQETGGSLPVSMFRDAKSPQDPFAD